MLVFIQLLCVWVHIRHIWCSILVNFVDHYTHFWFLCYMLCGNPDSWFAIVVCSDYKNQSHCYEPMHVLDFLWILWSLTKLLIQSMLKFHFTYLLWVYKFSSISWNGSSKRLIYSMLKFIFYVLVMSLCILNHELEWYFDMIIILFF